MHGQFWRVGCAGLLLAAACADGDSSQNTSGLTPANSPAASPGPAGVDPSMMMGAMPAPASSAAPPNGEGSPAVTGLQNPGMSGSEPPAAMPPAAMPPAAPALRFVGRVDTSDGNGARFAWSGTGVVAKFSGSSVGVRLSGGQQYTVLVDGVLQPKLVPTGGLDSLASGLADGPHQVELYRRTEASQGEAQLLGFDFGGGQLLAPPLPAERRIELVGDSISAGYGDEGADMNCPFTPDTENHYLTYGALAARELGAELSTVAWSGKGVVCNYGDDAASCTEPMPTYYDRVLPARANSPWDFSAWQPQAVVVNLGTNDFSTTSDPTEEQFEQAYGSLLDRIRAAYPDALILATVGPLLTGADLATARMYITNVVTARTQAGDAKIKSFELAPTNAADGYGCDWHPSLRTHQIMGDALTAKLRAELGW